MDRLMTSKDVRRKLGGRGKDGMGTSRFYDLRRDDPAFPEPIELAKGCLRWRESAIDAWIAERERKLCKVA